MSSVYDSTVRDVTRHGDPEGRLYEMIADRPGWAWQQGRALHVATGREVAVDFTGPPPSPYRIVLSERTWWLHDVETAVRMVETYGEPRYTLAEARAVEAKQRCAEEGHRLRVQHAADGSPDSVACGRCPAWWPVSTEHHTYVLDVLRSTLEFVGPETLPLEAGNPWYDALAHYWPDTAREMADAARDRLALVAQMAATDAVVDIEQRRAELRPEPAAQAATVDAPTVPALSLVDAPTVVVPAQRTGEAVDTETVPLTRPALVPLTGGAARPDAAG